MPRRVDVDFLEGCFNCLTLQVGSDYFCNLQVSVDRDRWGAHLNAVMNFVFRKMRLLT